MFGVIVFIFKLYYNRREQSSAVYHRYKRQFNKTKMEQRCGPRSKSQGPNTRYYLNRVATRNTHEKYESVISSNLIVFVSPVKHSDT